MKLKAEGKKKSLKCKRLFHLKKSQDARFIKEPKNVGKHQIQLMNEGCVHELHNNSDIPHLPA